MAVRMTRLSQKKLVSILIPVFNEEDNVDRAYRAVVEQFDKMADTYDLEILFTDNHSTDKTFSCLEAIAKRDHRVKVIRFSRNYGYQKSILIGYLNAQGDCAIQLDCDLQDPPELIPEMLRLWEEGNAVVYGLRRSRQEGWLINVTRRLFYRLIDALSETELPLDAGDFRLVDRCILKEMHLVDDGTPYLRGLISTMGFNQVSLPYDRAARAAGESKFNFTALAKLAIDGVVNHSLVPLRLASLSGIIIGALMLLGIGVFIVGRLFLGQAWPAGFATTTILLLFSITLNALFLGIIGEYLGRIYIQTKRKPVVIVERMENVTNIEMGSTGIAPHPQQISPSRNSFHAA